MADPDTSKASEAAPAPTKSSALEDAAKWFTAGFGVVTAATALAGASTDQLARLAMSFPRNVTWLYLCAVVAVVVAGAAWLVPSDAKIPRDQAWIAVILSTGVVWGAWFGLRVPAGPTFADWFPVVVTGVVVLLLVLGRTALTWVGTLLLCGLLLFVLSVGGAVYLGVSALKVGTSAFVSPTVTVEGRWATVSTVVKVTGLPVAGGVRLYLVDAAEPPTMLGSAYVSADVRGTVSATVPMRVHTRDSAVEVRLTRCTSAYRSSPVPTVPAPPPDEQIICSAPDAASATTYARVAVAGDVPAASLAASVAPTADGKLLVLTVSGSGLADPVTIVFGAPGNSSTATIRPDDSGGVAWTSSMPKATRSVSLSATSGAVKAKADYHP